MVSEISQFLDAATEEPEERRRAGLVENDLEPVSVWRGAGFASRRARERVLESRCCGAVIKPRAHDAVARALSVD